MGVFECVCAPAFKRNRYLSSLTDTMKMSDKLFGGGMSPQREREREAEWDGPPAWPDLHE